MKNGSGDAGDSCGNCRFFRKEPRALQANMVVGTCRKNPPTLSFMTTPAGTQPIGVFPPATDKGWCGAHKPCAPGTEVTAPAPQSKILAAS